MRLKLLSQTEKSPVQVSIERKLAPALLRILVTLLLASLFMVMLSIFAVGIQALTLRSLLPSILFVSGMFAAIFLLRTGRFNAAMLIVVAGVMFSLANSLLSSGLQNNRELLMVAALAITIAGLLMGRRALIAVMVLSIVLIVFASIWVVSAAPTTDSPEIARARLIYFILLISLISFFIDLFGSALRSALNTSLLREQELDEQREWLQITLSSIGDAVIATDTAGRVTFINPVAESLTGWRREETMGQPIDRMFHIVNEFTRQPAENPVERVLKEGIIVGLANHTMLIAKDGSESPIADSGAPIRNPRGEIIGAVLVFRDTSVEHQAEMTLKESESRFRTMADTAPVLIWTSGKDKLCDYFNKQWLVFTGRTMQQELGNGWMEGIHPDDYEICLQTYTTCFDLRQPFEMEYRMRRHDGEYRWLLDNGAPRFTEDGKFVGYIGSCIDIHERKQAQIELSLARSEAEAARQNLHDLFMEAPALIGILKGREGRVELFNPLFSQLWGNRPVMGKTMREAWPELATQGYYGIIEQVFDTGKLIYGNEYPSWIDRNNDGQLTLAYFNFVYQATHNAAGKVDGVAIYGVEVTEQVVARKHAEENEALLDALFATAPFGLAFLDRQKRYQRLNNALSQMNGLSIEAHIGQTASDVLPNLSSNEDESSIFTTVLESGESVSFEVNGETPAAPGYWLASYYPVQLHETTIGVGAIVVDITERKRNELRTRLLQEVTAALSEALTPSQVAEAIVTRGIYALGANVGYVSRVSTDDYAELLNREGIAPHLLQRFERIPLSAHTPMTDTIRTRQPVWIENLDDYRTHYPEIVQSVYPLTQTEALVFLPLIAHGRVIGGIGMSFPKPYRLNEEERNFLLLLANQCAQALERARLYESEQHRAQQLQKLAEASMAINAVLSTQDMLSVITHQAQEIIGAHQSVTTMTIDQGWENALISAALSEKYLKWHDYITPPDGSGIYRLVCDTNKPMRLTQKQLEAHPAWRSFGEEAAHHPPMRGWLAAPLTTLEGGNMGLIQLSDKVQGEFTEEDEAILVQLAQMASIALENIRLNQQSQVSAAYEERQRLARDLHDAVSQTLFASTTISEALPVLWKRKPERAFDQLAQMVILNRAAMAEMRSLLLELRPESIVKTSMQQLLNQLIEAAKGRKHIEADLSITAETGELPPDVHVAFYRIAQEGINNILKHSQATHFTIELDGDSDGWTLRLHDDGRGFDVEQMSAGLGLHSMQERAEKIGAQFEIESIPGDGTQLTLRWQPD